MQSYKVVYLILDGLDEFSVDHNLRHGLAKAFSGLQSDIASVDVRLCIVSREADDIYAQLPFASKIWIRASREDVRRFVQYRFDERAYAIPDKYLIGDVVDAITHQSDGV